MKRFLGTCLLLLFAIGCTGSTEAIKKETPAERPPQPSAEGGGGSGGGGDSGADVGTGTSEPPPEE